jgi:fused signal recognition particle receptor
VFNFFKRKKQDETEVQERTREALEKTRSSGGGFLSKLFEIDDITDQFWEDLKENLIKADIGYNLTEKLIQQSQKRTLEEDTTRSKEVERIFRQEMISILSDSQRKAQANVESLAQKEQQRKEQERRNAELERQRKEKQLAKQGKGTAQSPVVAPSASMIPTASPGASGEKRPYVIMVVGVNGSGKTTSIAKLAQYYKNGGASVVLGAADTFRAGAINQLKIWGERVGVPVIARQEGSDPSAVAFDTVKYANENGIDIVIIDTAGRLQTNFNLMDEMKKIERIIEKAQSGAPHEILLVLEAVTGQNGLSQAKHFGNAVGIDGIILTKLDGTAKGGVAFAIANELRIPIKYIGTGEKAGDFAEFEPLAYVDALF